jgi:hypothetical protein
VAGILLLSSILSFYLLIKTKGFWWKSLFVLHILIQLPAMFLAEIRGAQIAFFFVLLFISIVFLFKLESKKIKYGIVSFLFLLVVIFGLAFQNKEAEWVKNNSILHRLTSITLSGGTARTRLISWEAGLNALKERPVMGFGMENYYYAFDKYFQADYYNIASTETWFDRAHNMVMENLVAHGIFGILAYLSIFIVTLIYLYKMYKKDSEQNWLSSLFLSSLVIAYFIQNFFVFDSLTVTMVFFFLLAYINFKVTDSLESKIIYEEQLPKFANGAVISLSVIATFYLVFGMNVTHADVAKQNYEVQKSFYQDQDLLKTKSKMIDLFAINSYLNRDSVTMTTDTLTKITSQIKSQEQAQMAFKIIDFLINKFKEHEEINDQDAYMKLNMARLYMLKAGFLQKDSAAFKEVLNKAKIVIEKSVELSPERLHNFYFLSKIDIALGDYQGAVDAMEKALSYNDKYADTYLYLNCYAKSTLKNR